MWQGLSQKAIYEQQKQYSVGCKQKHPSASSNPDVMHKMQGASQTQRR